MPKPDDINEIEAMLADLPTREPSQMLDARVASALNVSTRPTQPWLAIAAAVLICGAVTVAVLLIPALSDPDTQLAAEHLPTPSSLTNEPPSVPRATDKSPAILDAVWTRDVAEQTRYTATGRPYKAVLRESMYQRAWVDPSGSSYEIQVPWHELIVVSQPTF